MAGLAFAMPGRWTGGKREEDEMRRLMAKEAEEAKARGELLEETSASDWSSADDENANEDKPKVEEPKLAFMSNSLEPSDLLRRKRRDDNGHEADMDDTSMSSRASSRMLESINVMSMDSMNVM